MGFRGEAMASMAAISHLELKTKLHDKELGTKLIVEGSELKSQENCATNKGHLFPSRIYFSMFLLEEIS